MFSAKVGSFREKNPRLQSFVFQKFRLYQKGFLGSTFVLTDQDLSGFLGCLVRFCGNSQAASYSKWTCMIGKAHGLGSMIHV